MTYLDIFDLFRDRQGGIKTPQKKPENRLNTVFSLAPAVGFEPTTTRLTVGGSTAELRRNISLTEAACSSIVEE